MPRHRYLASALALIFALLAAPEARGLDPYAYSFGLQGVVGGSLSSEPDSGLDNLGGQLLFSWQSELRTYVVGRLGRLALEVDDTGLFDSDLTWATISGEYRFTDAAWDSGLFIGLGLYEESENAFQDGDSGVGLTLGTTALFPIFERFAVYLELAGHLTELDRAETFATVGVGVTISF